MWPNNEKNNKITAVNDATISAKSISIVHNFESKWAKVKFK